MTRGTPDNTPEELGLDTCCFTAVTIPLNKNDLCIAHRKHNLLFANEYFTINSVTSVVVVEVDTYPTAVPRRGESIY